MRALTTVQEVEGDLVELGARQSGKRELPEWERRRFYCRAARVTPKSKGYAPGWASHQFKQKFKHWPNGYDRVAMSPSVCDPQLGEIAPDRLREEPEARLMAKRAPKRIDPQPL